MDEMSPIAVKMRLIYLIYYRKNKDQDTKNKKKASFKIIKIIRKI